MYVLCCLCVSLLIRDEPLAAAAAADCGCRARLL